LHAMARAGHPAQGPVAREMIDGALQMVAPSPRQIAAVEAVRDLADGVCPDADAALAALEEIVDARIGPYEAAFSLAAAFAPMAPEAMATLLMRCRNRPALSLMRFHVAAR